MHVLIVQLSDLHIRSSEDPLIDLTSKIADAVKGLSYEASTCVLALTGDVTDSGDEDQYLGALDFVTRLDEHIRRGIVGLSRVQCVVIPGNHDCDLSAESAARQTIIDGITKRSLRTVDASEEAVCTECQKAFFDFREAASGLKSGVDRLYYEYSIDMGTDGSLLIRCCNSAWLSGLHERPSTLHYPCDLIPNQNGEHKVAVTLLHHPYQWFIPETGRQLRERLQEVSDIIMTGHEHAFSAHAQVGWKGERNLYIEGGALQGVEEDSAFNVVVLDPSRQLQKLVTFRWRDECYQPDSRDWEPYQMNQVRSAHLMLPNDSFRAQLNDLGVVLEHPARGRIVLSDVFVYPDLREPSSVGKTTLPPFSSRHLLEKASELERILITGADKSGKTCLAQKLWIDFFEAGYVPLLVHGADLKVHTSDALLRVLDNTFPGAFNSSLLTKYHQLDRKRRVLIVDDFDRAEGIKGSVRGLVNVLASFAGQVVLIAADLAQHLRDLTEPEAVTVGESRFTHFRIVPYLHVRRHELIERWCALDPVLSGDSEALARQLVNLKSMVDAVIGKNFMPSYPIFILPLLQAYAHGEAVNVNASTYGYYYELLIRRSLASGSHREHFDVKLGYLAFLAYSAFTKSLQRLDDATVRELHQQYEDKYALTIPFIPLHAQLTKSEVLETNADGSSHFFTYPYIYYYFVASYIRDHIGEAAVRDQVADLAHRLGEEHSANIMLFLAHVSKDPFVVDQLVLAAQSRFSTCERATLSSDEPVWAALDRSLDEFVFDDPGDGHGRRTAMMELDASEERLQTEGDSNLEQAQVAAMLTDLRVAYRTLQILGQVVRNFPGSLDGATKKRIVDECYGVGLRSLSAVLGMVEGESDNFVHTVASAQREARASLRSAQLSQKARDSVYGMMNLVSYGTVRRIVAAVGSPHLFKVYEGLASDSSPAMALVHASLNLDHREEFPEDHVLDLNRRFSENPPAQTVLKTLVVGHLYMYDVKYQVKQRVCSKLEISYHRIQVEGRRSRLLK